MSNLEISQLLVYTKIFTGSKKDNRLYVKLGNNYNAKIYSIYHFLCFNDCKLFGSSAFSPTVSLT